MAEKEKKESKLSVGQLCILGSAVALVLSVFDTFKDVEKVDKKTGKRLGTEKVRDKAKASVEVWDAKFTGSSRQTVGVEELKPVS